MLTWVNIFTGTLEPKKWVGRVWSLSFIGVGGDKSTFRVTFKLTIRSLESLSYEVLRDISRFVRSMNIFQASKTAHTQQEFYSC